ncbi:MAG: heavy metal translocating P-type ATPase [bacterium]
MTRTYAYRIAEMDCADEVRLLKDALLPLVGDESNLSFDLMRARLTVSVPEGGPKESAIREVVSSTGMHAVPWAEALAQQANEGFWTRRGRAILCAAGGLLIATSFFVHAFRVGFGGALASARPIPFVSLMSYAAASILGLWYLLPKAWLSLRRARPDMNLLMTLAVIGAMLLGEWFEAASVAVLFAFALLLESWSVERARRSVETLLEEAPRTARVVTPDGVREVAVDHVEVGGVLRIAPGERIALDGVILQGRSAINTAPITGESIPTDVSPGDTVYAGTINGRGALEIRTTKKSSDTTFAHIIRLVEKARSRRASSERWVETFSRYYTPSIFTLAAAVALLGPLFAGGVVSVWAYRALVLLVIACPCALVISTPVSVIAGLTASSRAGILMKGGIFLELPGKIRTFAFDKTGTLTRGEPAVIAARSLVGEDSSKLLAIAAALESRSRHTLARAVVSFVEKQNIAPATVKNMEELNSTGVHGWVNDREYWIGGERLYAQLRRPEERVEAEFKTFHSQGATAIVLFDREKPLLLFALADEPRDEAPEVIRQLKSLGIQHIVMLTGDHPEAAARIADRVGIHEVKSSLLPEEKLRAVETLIQTLGPVAMVGDGINDAPALARSTVSVAMGTMGSDAAMEVADIALMGEDLGHLPWLIRHSRRSLGIIRTNIIFAIGVKVLFLVLAAFDLATLWMAIAADMGTSLLVIANALRLLNNKY